MRAAFALAETLFALALLGTGIAAAALLGAPALAAQARTDDLRTALRLRPEVASWAARLTPEERAALAAGASLTRALDWEGQAWTLRLRPAPAAPALPGTLWLTAGAGPGDLPAAAEWPLALPAP